MRTRAERRKFTWHKALRRRELEMDTNLSGHEPQFDNLHEYSKAKLYSVGRRCKTNNKGEHRYAPKNYVNSDLSACYIRVLYMPSWLNGRAAHL